MTGDHYPHQERELAAAAGLSQDDLKKIRRRLLTRGRDFDTVGGFVCYTAAAAVAIWHEVGLDLAGAPRPADSATNNPPEEKISAADEAPSPAAEPAPPSAAAEAVPPAAGDLRELVCVKRFFPNTRLLGATYLGQTVRVKVRDNKNFVAGMKLQCRLEQGDLWVLAQRLPRWRGKW